MEIYRIAYPIALTVLGALSFVNRNVFEILEDLDLKKEKDLNSAQNLISGYKIGNKILSIIFGILATWSWIILISE